MHATQDPSDDLDDRWYRSPMVRRAIIAGLVLLISAPLVTWGSDQSLRSMFNAPLLWIDHEAESRRDFNEFLELFGSHEMIVVSWDGCEVDDDRLAAAKDALEAVQQQRADDGKLALFNYVLTGKTMIEQLTEPPIDVRRETALKRLQGVLVGPDGKTSCVVVELTADGGVNRRKTIPLIKETISAATGLAEDQLYLSGPSVDGLAIDYESSRTIQAYSLPSVLISLLLCWVCLRSLLLTIPIVIIGAWGQGLMLSSVYYSGSTMNAVLIVLPALVFVLTVSAGVHLANYFLEEVDGDAISEAPRRAMAKATGPCTLAAVTTAIGLASLCISEVQPVRQFGYLGAIGLLVCVGLLFLLVPGTMVIWLQLNKRRLKAVHGNGDQFVRFAHLVYRHGLAIRLLCLAAMVGCGAGLVHLRTSISVFSLLSDDNRAVRDFYWIEENICPLVPIEVIVHFDNDCELDAINRLKVVSAIQRQIGEIDVLDGEMSAVTFIPAFPRGGFGGTVRKTVFLKQIERSREGLIAGKYLAETGDGEAWRISGRIEGKPEFDYAGFLEQLQAEIDPILDKVHTMGHPGVTASSTGVLMVVYQVQEVLLDDLFRSFLTALVLVALVMMFALRSVTCGLLAMLPNVFPTLILFGAMGWSDRAIDIGSVMTASVALGIAVDGTFHFLKWFVQSLKEGHSQELAITTAYQRCARALIQTTIICACGLLIYSFSGFLPARNFAWVLLLMLVAALFGDLVLLPALLAGGLGRLLCRVYQPHQPVAAESAGASEPVAGQADLPASESTPPTNQPQ